MDRAGLYRQHSVAVPRMDCHQVGFCIPGGAGVLLCGTFDELILSSGLWVDTYLAESKTVPRGMMNGLWAD